MNDHEERLSRALAYIESNLDGELTLQQVADAACYSAFHFDRVFRAQTGDSVFAYVRKRRLSRAFDAVAESKRRIIDIALEFRYESAAAFTRAFKGQFRINPSLLRARRKRTIYGYYCALDPVRLSRRMTGGISLNAEIKKRALVTMVGMACANTAKKNTIPALWGRFIRKAVKISGLLDKGTYGVYIYDFSKPMSEVDEDMAFDYLAAGEWPQTEPAKPVPEGFVTHALPERTYAVFRHTGKLSKLGTTYEYIYGVWFPASGRQALSAEHFEYHGPDFKGDFDDSVTEIWIPLLD